MSVADSSRLWAIAGEELTASATAPVRNFVIVFIIALRKLKFVCDVAIRRHPIVVNLRKVASLGHILPLKQS